MPIKLKASDLVRTLTSKDRFVPILERSIAKNDYEWEFKYEAKHGDDAWHPSGDCTPSLNQLYHTALDRMDPEVAAPAISGSLRKTFMVGHFWHQWLQFHAVKAGICDSRNVERVGTKFWGEPVSSASKEDAFYMRAHWYKGIGYQADIDSKIKGWLKTDTEVIEPKPFHWTRGSADIAPATLDGEDWVIDFKTTNPTDFKAESPPERFRNKWECQMNIYMDFFGYEQACVIAIDKLTGAMKEFVYKRNQPLVEAIYTKWRLVGEYLEKEAEPPETEEIFLPFQGVFE